MANAIRAFSQFPEQYQLVRANPALIKAAFEESLRWDSPSRMAGRIAMTDVEIDGHHTVEDVGILLGETFREALGDKAGVRRFASGLFPLDEALIEVALDLSGRPYLVYDVPFGEVLPLGTPPFNPEMAEHFFRSFVDAAHVTLHVTRKGGTNTHHVIEATFKGVARCIRDAVRVEGTALPSTKGVL